VFVANTGSTLIGRLLYTLVILPLYLVTCSAYQMLTILTIQILHLTLIFFLLIQQYINTARENLSKTNCETQRMETERVGCFPPALAYNLHNTPANGNQGPIPEEMSQTPAEQ
jgi:hypothetical protein